MSRNGTLVKLPHYDCRGPNNPKWNGGKTKDGQGRVYVLAVDHPHANAWGYVYRYRINMEKKIGRVLRWDESVHHKDGDCSNDAIENLELVTFSEHAKIHNTTRDRNAEGKFI